MAKKITKDKKANPDLMNKMKSAIQNLSYMSETDAPFEAFVWQPEAGAGAFSDVSANDVLHFAEKPADAPIKEFSTEDFFRQPTADQDWYGDDEKATAQRFRDLESMLASELKNVKVFKIGDTELDVYIVGVTPDGDLAGVKTQATET